MFNFKEILRLTKKLYEAERKNIHLEMTVKYRELDIGNLTREVHEMRSIIENMNAETEAVERKKTSEAVIAKNRFIIVPMASGERGEGKTIYSLIENHLTHDSRVEKIRIGSFATKPKAQNHLNAMLKYEEEYK